MADDAWFYIESNIVGYTGVLDKIDKPPTVYFVHKDDEGWIHYGHITQYHTCPENVGRQRVRKCRFYAITNQVWTFTDDEMDPPQKVTRKTAHECISDEADADIDGDDPIENKRHIWIGKGFAEIHPSRNPFIQVNDGNRTLLATAIAKFQKQKLLHQHRRHHNPSK